jgi:hypothetical protein
MPARRGTGARPTATPLAGSWGIRFQKLGPGRPEALHVAEEPGGGLTPPDGYDFGVRRPGAVGDARPAPGLDRAAVIIKVGPLPGRFADAPRGINTLREQRHVTGMRRNDRRLTSGCVKLACSPYAGLLQLFTSDRQWAEFVSCRSQARGK